MIVSSLNFKAAKVKPDKRKDFFPPISFLKDESNIILNLKVHVFSQCINPIKF